MRYSWFSSQGLWTEWPQPWRSSNHSEPSRSGRCRRGKSTQCRLFTLPMNAGLLNLWFSIAPLSVSRSGGSIWNFPGDLRPSHLSKNTFRRLLSQLCILRRASTWTLTSSYKSRVRAWDLSSRTSSSISDIPMSKNNQQSMLASFLTRKTLHPWQVVAKIRQSSRNRHQLMISIPGILCTWMMWQRLPGSATIPSPLGYGKPSMISTSSACMKIRSRSILTTFSEFSIEPPLIRCVRWKILTKSSIRSKRQWIWTSDSISSPSIAWLSPRLRKGLS